MSTFRLYFSHFLCLPGGKSAMASAKKVAEKRHNPVESICRKLRAIHKREDISDLIRQIIKYQSSSFDSPQTNPKKDFEEVLSKMIAVHIPLFNMLFSSPEKDGAFISVSDSVSKNPSHLSCQLSWECNVLTYPHKFWKHLKAEITELPGLYIFDTADHAKGALC